MNDELFSALQIWKRKRVYRRIICLTRYARR